MDTSLGSLCLAYMKVWAARLSPLRQRHESRCHNLPLRRAFSSTYLSWQVSFGGSTFAEVERLMQTGC